MKFQKIVLGAWAALAAGEAVHAAASVRKDPAAESVPAGSPVYGNWQYPVVTQDSFSLLAQYQLSPGKLTSRVLCWNDLRDRVRVELTVAAQITETQIKTLEDAKKDGHDGAINHCTARSNKGQTFNYRVEGDALIFSNPGAPAEAKFFRIP